MLNLAKHFTDTASLDAGRPWTWYGTPFSFIVRSVRHKPFADALQAAQASGALPNGIRFAGDMPLEQRATLAGLVATHLVVSYTEDGTPRPLDQQALAIELAKPEADELIGGLLHAAADIVRYRRTAEDAAVGKPQPESDSEVAA